jgi:hypothetical protein
MRPTIVALTCTVAGLLALLALPASSASADSPVPHPRLPAFRQTLTKATLTLQSPAVVTFGDNVTIAGQLSLGAGSPPAGTPITVVRTEAGGTTMTKFTVYTVPGGAFTVTDPDPAKGKYTYTATYKGTVTTTPAEAVIVVTVARTAPFLTVETSAPDYTFGTRIFVTAILGPTFADRSISIYAMPVGRPARLLKTAEVNAHGELTVTYILFRNTTFTAVFAGDAHNAPRTADRTVGAWVRVYMSGSGYFKTVVIDHIPYHVYHHTADLNALARVVPNKASECVDLELQQFSSQFGWYPNETFGCFGLNKQSEVSQTFSLTEVQGAQFRMRADYVHSRRDTANLSTDGSWFYFEVVK